MVKKAIILAAGMGTRLKPFTLTNHKCLTEVNNTPILINTLRILKDCSFNQVTLVVGYLKELIYERIGDNFYGMKIVYAQNGNYDKTNTSWSLKLGLDTIEYYDELFIIEGDVFFEKKLLEDLLNCKKENVTVVEPYNTDLDGTFVELGENQYVVDWTHKSDRTPEYILTNKYKTVNIHKFSAEFMKTFLTRYLEKSIKLYKGQEPIEKVLRKLVRENSYLVEGFVLNGQKWFEIDDLDDLLKAEKIFS